MDPPDYIQLLIDHGIYEALDTNNFNLQLRSILSIPEAVGAFEEQQKLPITGDWKQMVKNYNQVFYTSRCEKEESWDICLPKAAASNNISVLTQYMRKYHPIRYSEPYHEAAFQAAKYNRIDVLNLLIGIKGTLNPALAGALVGGNNDLFLELSQRGGSITIFELPKNNQDRKN